MNSVRFTISMIAISSVLILMASGLWLTNPEIDLVVERVFYKPGQGFVLNYSPAIAFIRRVAIYGYGLWYAIIIISVLFSRNNDQWPLSKYFGLDFIQWLYLAITSLIGPLLIANIMLKNNWGRARPRQVEEFGGTQEFSPPLVISDQCQTNCSFVSGEPSSMFMIFFALAFLMPQRRAMLVVMGFVLGALSGLMRMGQGGHFLSDVVFAGLFMALVAAIIYWIMFLTNRLKTQR